VWPLVLAADKLAEQSVEAFKRWDYLEAVSDARQAYSLVPLAAQQIGASTPTLDAARRALPGTAVRRIVCTIRNPFD